MNVTRTAVTGLMSLTLAGTAAAPALADPPSEWPLNLRQIEETVVVRPDDRADRRLPTAGFASPLSPATGDDFDWGDAIVGAAAALGVAVIVTGTSVASVRRRPATLS